MMVDNQNQVTFEDKEKLMFINIEKNINSEFFLNILKKNYERYHNVHYIGDLIGELYIHHIIHKDGYDFESYMKQFEELYSAYKDRELSPEQFELQKSKMIAGAIASKLGIDVHGDVKDDDLSKIQNYFLQEYVSYGYVTHAFPDAYYDSIVENGLVASISDRIEKPKDIQQIQDLFMAKGITSPMGGYPYYGGSGIYYEHDFTRVFQHAVDSPEWFNWFTSSDHTATYHKNVETSPYILRSEENCRVNVEDLCRNADLNSYESKKVLDFFQEQYRKFSSPKLNVAFIPKRVVGKSDISKAVPSNMDLLSTISYVLKDGAKQYTEHNGNVHFETITPEQFKISVIPSANIYMFANQYFRESKEHLTNFQSNLSVLDTVENNQHRLVPSMIPKIEVAKQVIIDKQNQSNCFFDQRSPKEIELANQIKQKNQIIKAYNAEQKQQDRPKVKTLGSATVRKNNGFSSGISLLLVVCFIVIVLFIIILVMDGR
ncbi:MAG: hypothetical protein UC703_05130 [Bacilli bacterium]|nr:hypothetical protein [Bacilli bacterium]